MFNAFPPLKLRHDYGWPTCSLQRGPHLFSPPLIHFVVIFLFSFSFTFLHIKPHTISFSYIYYFSFPGHLLWQFMKNTSFFSSTRSLRPHILIFLFFHFPPHKATHNLIFLYIYIYYFFFSWPSSLTIHEEHLMRALIFLPAWNFLYIMHLPDMGMQAI